MAQSITNTDHTRRLSLRVRGVVQGVGFRPTVFRLATEENLGGFIGNDSDGVFIEIEGPAPRVESFLIRLRSEAPPLARIESVEATELTPHYLTDPSFRIEHSHDLGLATTGIPADAATCNDCVRELFDQQDRRYRYPFLNCTNCGPRYTITRHIPYDRPQTSMSVFKMCLACQREYDSPVDRRFHAQPNACPACGPSLSLVDAANNPLSSDSDLVATLIEHLVAGKIAAIKGLGGFHLAVDPTNEQAVAVLRTRKHRYGKPLAIMVRSLEHARSLAHLTAEEEAQLMRVERPIVLARMREGTKIAANVAPNLPWLGIFLPYTPLHHLLLADDRLPALVMTSANLSEEPIAIDNDEARARLGEIADVFLLHNREILQRCDDSVLAVVDGAPQLIRRARGFVPFSIALPGTLQFDAPPLLAVGGHLKNVFTLARGKHAFQSQHLGDLENLTGLNFFEEALAHLRAVFDINPEIIVHDLHPGYLSTEWALEQAQPKIAVQHHHAHIAACIAEHGVTDSVIGLALDGTGYGTDGAVWGGELLIASLKDFTRHAHIAYAPMPGSAAAIREPNRMALGSLLAAGIELTPKILERLNLTEKQAIVMRQMVERKINTPQTSSCGRLFDAVAALVLSRHTVDYEAQAAVELEGCADEDTNETGYSFDLIEDADANHLLQINPSPMWRAILADLESATAPKQISNRFHAGLARAWTRAALHARAQTGLTTVALSGGVFHNRLLSKLLRRNLEAEGFRVLTHSQVSPGDGGLSYGQAAIAAAKLK